MQTQQKERGGRRRRAWRLTPPAPHRTAEGVAAVPHGPAAARRPAARQRHAAAAGGRAGCAGPAHAPRARALPRGHLREDAHHQGQQRTDGEASPWRGQGGCTRPLSKRPAASSFPSRQAHHPAARLPEPPPPRKHKSARKRATCRAGAAHEQRRVAVLPPLHAGPPGLGQVPQQPAPLRRPGPPRARHAQRRRRRRRRRATAAAADAGRRDARGCRGAGARRDGERTRRPGGGRARGGGGGARGGGLGHRGAAAAGGDGGGPGAAQGAGGGGQLGSGESLLLGLQRRWVEQQGGWGMRTTRGIVCLPELAGPRGSPPHRLAEHCSTDG